LQAIAPGAGSRLKGKSSLPSRHDARPASQCRFAVRFTLCHSKSVPPPFEERPASRRHSGERPPSFEERFIPRHTDELPTLFHFERSEKSPAPQPWLTWGICSASSFCMLTPCFRIEMSIEWRKASINAALYHSHRSTVQVLRACIAPYSRSSDTSDVADSVEWCAAPQSRSVDSSGVAKSAAWCNEEGAQSFRVRFAPQSRSSDITRVVESAAWRAVAANRLYGATFVPYSRSVDMVRHAADLATLPLSAIRLCGANPGPSCKSGGMSCHAADLATSRLSPIRLNGAPRHAADRAAFSLSPIRLRDTS